MRLRKHMGCMTRQGMTARTIKRVSLPLNAGKRETLQRVATDYAAEKQHWLELFQAQIALLAAPEQVRDQARKDKHKSVLPSTVWAMALKDAAETMDRYWSALFVEMRRLIASNGNLDDEQQRYAYQILKDYRKLAALFADQDVADKVLDEQQRHQVRYYLNRVIKRQRGALPRGKLVRSFALDKCMYGIETLNGKQVLWLGKALCGSKLWIPLKGLTDLSRPSSRLAKDGTRARAMPNVRVVLIEDHIELHYMAQVKRPEPKTGAIIAVDFGYSEVMVDSNGKHYGDAFGQRMTEATEFRTDKGRKRGKLRALAEKYHAQGKHKKARNIRRRNLGRKKLNAQRDRQQQAIEHQINTALNQVTKDADVLVSENLSAVFSYGKGRQWNRRLSAWVRGALQERTAFKALAGCSGHQQVNPAYTSQTCPSCGFVHSHNRHFDTFQCSHCGFAAHADEVAATNLLNRVDDREITLYTPYQRVKAILEERFRRRQESEGPALMRCQSGPLTAGLEKQHEEASAA